MATDTSFESPDIDYKALFRSSPERKIVFKANDPYYTFVEVTDSHSNMTGVSRKKLIGYNFFDVFPDTSDSFKKTGVSNIAEDFRSIIKTKRTIASGVYRYDIPARDGTFQERYWKTVHSPICDEFGNVAYIVQLSNDVTAEVIAEHEAEEMRMQLQDALQIGKVGSWAWDVDKDVIIADANLADMFGLAKTKAAKGIPLNMFTGAIHEEDRPKVLVSIQKAIQHKTTFEEEYRTLGPKGRISWVLARGKIEKRDGKVLFPGVVVDITERRELQAEIELAHQQDLLNRQTAQNLQQRNEELESISRTKDEFVALASHQLRTPATAVKQYVGMVLQGYVGTISDLQRDMLDKAFESNERQIQIINQILNAARVDTGRLMLSPVKVDLVELTRGICEEMRSSLEQRKHTFTVQLPNKPVWATADLGYLRMAVENLIHNAGIYTPDGGAITVSLQQAGDTAQIVVADNGVGIKKSDLKRLFAKFSRIHNPLSVQAGGSGIGLYLAAEIVRLHKGEITVTSKLHQGTTFAISLPIAHNNR